MAKHYKELFAWQKAMELVTEIYKITGAFPEVEKWGLTSQMRRAAVSVPSNIAEGQGRLSRGEFRQFLGHARGSLNEVETQLVIARNLEMVSEDNAQRLEKMIAEVGRILNGLIRSKRANATGAVVEKQPPATGD